MEEQRAVLVDHYAVLGLPSTGGGGGAKLSEEEIRKAYRRKALLLHPDKRADHKSDDFQKLQRSYQVLIDPVARRTFHQELFQQQQCRQYFDTRQQQEYHDSGYCNTEQEVEVEYAHCWRCYHKLRKQKQQPAEEYRFTDYHPYDQRSDNDQEQEVEVEYDSTGVHSHGHYNCRKNKQQPEEDSFCDYHPSGDRPDNDQEQELQHHQHRQIYNNDHLFGRMHQYCSHHQYDNSLFYGERVFGYAWRPYHYHAPILQQPHYRYPSAGSCYGNHIHQPPKESPFQNKEIEAYCRRELHTHLGSSRAVSQPRTRRTSWSIFGCF